MGVLRSDYMVSQSGRRPTLRQVEINTIASSFGFLSERVCRAHRMLALKFPQLRIQLEDMPQNRFMEAIPSAFARALVLYEYKCNIRTQLSKEVFDDERQLKAELARQKSSTLVLFVVQPDERNIADQRFLEFELLSRYGIRSVRKTLAAIGEENQDRSDSILRANEEEVAISYFRAGYTPDDYPNESCWLGRELIESSRSIKCPDIATHLLGTKKVQQYLAKDGVVEKYIFDDEAVRRIRATFATQYGLGVHDDDRELGIAAAKASPELFVLKPQREGGGNNIFGAGIPSHIESMDDSALSAFVLQERFFPTVTRSMFVRSGEIFESDIESELGIFGVLIGSDEKVFLNEYSGHLLRSKVASSNETGFMLGFGMIDSIFLT
mmetsp:Transcript_1756/g.3719  ORF Transcript_1756/g.3719 Transcript_1756/m.3719 type:complete len:382 (-) Transcript_1756:858-2003(-)